MQVGRFDFAGTAAGLRQDRGGRFEFHWSEKRGFTPEQFWQWGAIAGAATGRGLARTAERVTEDHLGGCHGFGIFDKAVSSWFDNVYGEHGLMVNGKEMSPLLRPHIRRRM